MSVQLPLSLGPRDSATFASYLPGPNQQAAAYLQSLTGAAGEPSIYLWGPAGSGKSHLLQAACHAAGERATAAVYLPLKAADQFPCEALAGLENVAVVCIDDVHAIAGRRDWEMAVLDLFERIFSTGRGLAVSGNVPPAGLPLALPQLQSRLTWGLVLELRSLDSAQALHALQLRAARRGFDLPAEVGKYLLRHCGQDMNALFDTLDALDR
ncbi:MAG: DnaA regulatory inactivator Hda, partial [Pseudomonadota bacterium]|nr:DnaA regulatory inactivator Hda [Pseudomonadota bacterium]